MSKKTMTKLKWMARQTRLEQAAAAAEAFAIRVSRMRPHINPPGKGLADGRLDAFGIPGVAAASDVATRNHLQQLRVTGFAFAQIRVQIDRRHIPVPALVPTPVN